MILIDADVLGRERTGDETYVTNLLRELPAAAPDLDFAAVTRRPDLVPAGVEPLILLPRLHIRPSRFDVTGVLAHWRTPSPVSAIDPGETNRVMRVPFTALADPDKRIMLSTSFGWRGPAFVLEGAVVWGYTGEILAALLRLGGWERPWAASNPIDLDQAWRQAG